MTRSFETCARAVDRPRTGTHWLFPRRKYRAGGITDQIVAAIVVIVVLAVLVGMASVATRIYKDNRLISMISRAVTVIDSTYANKRFPNDSLLPSLAVSGAFTSAELQKGQFYRLISPFGDPIMMNGSSLGTFSVNASALPASACSSLVAHFLSEPTRVTKAQVNSTELTAPYDQAAAQAACNTTDNYVSLFFHRL